MLPTASTSIMSTSPSSSSFWLTFLLQYSASCPCLPHSANDCHHPSRHQCLHLSVPGPHSRRYVLKTILETRGSLPSSCFVLIPPKQISYSHSPYYKKNVLPTVVLNLYFTRRCHTWLYITYTYFSILFNRVLKRLQPTLPSSSGFYADDPKFLLDLSLPQSFRTTPSKAALASIPPSTQFTLSCLAFALTISEHILSNGIFERYNADVKVVLACTRLFIGPVLHFCKLVTVVACSYLMTGTFLQSCRLFSVVSRARPLLRTFLHLCTFVTLQ